MDQFDEQRKQIEKRYVQQDYGFVHFEIENFFVEKHLFSRQLLRQHKAKLHKRAKEIQEQLVRFFFRSID